MNEGFEVLKQPFSSYPVENAGRSGQFLLPPSIIVFHYYVWNFENENANERRRYEFKSVNYK